MGKKTNEIRKRWMARGTSGVFDNNNRVYSASNKPTPADIGAAASSHTHNYAGSSSAGGNANAAVKLATARTINGTNFNGTANITTANWGTARTITIGSKGKSVNGSGNVSWTLDEIGAAAKSHTHTNLVTKTVSNSTLTLGTELYQYAAISSTTTIKLPSVSAFTEIHLFFNWPANVSVTMPSGVKWQQGVMYGPGHVHEFVFTYVNNIGWLGGCVVYG